MKLLFLLFFILFQISNASNIYEVSLDKSVQIHRVIEVGTNIDNIDDAIKNPQKFREVKYFRRYFQKKLLDSSSWYKIKIHNNSQNTLKKEIFTKWENTDIEMYLVNNKKLLTQSKLQEYDNFKLSQPFSIESNQTLEIYLNVKIKKSVENYYYLYVISEGNLDLISQKDRFFNNGLFLGLLIAMMMYNFFMYFSMKIKSYLYLGIYQFSVVFYVSDLRYFAIILFDDFQTFSYLIFKLLASSIILILSIIFTKEFLNTKNSMPVINRLLNLFIIMHIIFQFVPEHSVNYSAFLYALYVIAGFVSFRQGNKFAIFYMLGFTPTVIAFASLNINKALYLNNNFEYPSAIQVLAVIEAFALSMALYLKLKQTVDEKEKAQKEAMENEKMLLEQSKFATMGELLASIAHQWRQPLNHLNGIFGNLVLAYDSNKLDKSYLDKKSFEADKQLKYMSDTIEDFSNFFSTKDKLDSFSSKEICEETFELIYPRVKKYNINISLITKKDRRYQNYKSEFIQVLLVVFNNAIDALKLNNIENRKIEVVLDENTIYIEDNAGGISQDVIDKVFDPYFSTKDKKFGSGLGLYTAKMMMKSVIKGKISVQNGNDGAKFKIEFTDIKSS